MTKIVLKNSFVFAFDVCFGNIILKLHRLRAMLFEKNPLHLSVLQYRITILFIRIL